MAPTDQPHPPDRSADVAPATEPSQGTTSLPGELLAAAMHRRTTAFPVYTSKSDMVTAALRELVMTGQLAGGTQLRQRELAEVLGVSPTPVREALRRLEAEGLLASNPHKGSTVVAADFGATETNYRIRAALESLAAELAADNITEAELAELHELNERLRALPDDDQQRQALNAEFHFKIYACARSPLMIALVRLLWRAFPGGPQAVRPAGESVDQHGDLIEALRAHDGARAARINEAHILGAVEYLTNDAQRPPP